MKVNEKILRRIIKEAIEEMTAYHGSPANFDKFNHKKFMSTGCHSQTFGWGTYVTDDKAIGDSYAEKFNVDPWDDFECPFYDGKTIDEWEPLFKEMFRKSAIKIVKDDNRRFQLAYAKTSFDKFYEYLKYVDWNINDTYHHFLNEEKSDLKQLGYYYNRGFERLFKEKQKKHILNKIICDVLENQIDMNLWQDYPDDKHSYLYEVEIPDDNGENYLDWYNKCPPEFMIRILNGLHCLRPSFLEKMANHNYPFKSGLYLYLQSSNFEKIAKIIASENDYHTFFGLSFYNGLTRKGSGGEIYRYLQSLFMSAKAVSLFLLNCCGFIGIKYESGTKWNKPDGAKEDGHNYVLFNANDVKIINKTELSLI